MQVWIAVALALVASPTSAAAAEIDSITGRDRPLADATATLERRLNAALERGIRRANEQSSPCDEDVLHRELRRALADPFLGHAVAQALDGDDSLDRRRVRRADSIYRDLGLLDAIGVHWKDLSSVVRVGDALIGVDKLGHFVVEGWGYSELIGEGGIEGALAWGENTEETYFGRLTTGVGSYADLVANFEGMRFWMRVRGAGSDPLDEGWSRNRPYVSCGRRLGLFGARKWRQRRKLELDDYVSPAWDEAVNCSSYRNEEIAALVEARIAEQSRETGVDLTCPVDPDACVAARDHYGALAPRLLHPACLAARPTRRPWWRFWD